MAKNKFKEKNVTEPIEKHTSAAWANVSQLKPVSRVPIPDEIEVKNAKEWVDSNQK